MKDPYELTDDELAELLDGPPPAWWLAGGNTDAEWSEMRVFEPSTTRVLIEAARVLREGDEELEEILTSAELAEFLANEELAKHGGSVAEIQRGTLLDELAGSEIDELTDEEIDEMVAGPPPARWLAGGRSVEEWYAMRDFPSDANRTLISSAVVLFESNEQLAEHDRWVAEGGLDYQPNYNATGRGFGGAFWATGLVVGCLLLLGWCTAAVLGDDDETEDERTPRSTEVQRVTTTERRAPRTTRSDADLLVECYNQGADKTGLDLAAWSQNCRDMHGG